MNIPNHLAIIIDGNRRWSKENNLPTLEGHKRGYDNIKKIGEYAWDKGVKIITVYCFSTENWNRDQKEVSYLMDLLGMGLEFESTNYYHKKGIKIQIIGQKERLSDILQQKIKDAEKLTKNNKNGILNLCISYGGRTEITEAIKNIVKNNQEISEDSINNNLWTKGMSGPDFIIRSGGEKRLSNFLTWQSVYSELYFTDKYWPDFNEKDLDQALLDYSDRQRRYGK